MAASFPGGIPGGQNSPGTGKVLNADCGPGALDATEGGEARPGAVCLQHLADPRNLKTDS